MVGARGLASCTMHAFRMACLPAVLSGSATLQARAEAMTAGEIQRWVATHRSTCSLAVYDLAPMRLGRLAVPWVGRKPDGLASGIHRAASRVESARHLTVLYPDDVVSRVSLEARRAALAVKLARLFGVRGEDFEALRLATSALHRLFREVLLEDGRRRAEEYHRAEAAALAEERRT